MESCILPNRGVHIFLGATWQKTPPWSKIFPAECFAPILRNKERRRQKTKGSLDTEEEQPKIVLMCSRGGAGSFYPNSPREARPEGREAAI